MQVCCFPLFDLVLLVIVMRVALVRVADSGNGTLRSQRFYNLTETVCANYRSIMAMAK